MTEVYKNEKQDIFQFPESSLDVTLDIIWHQAWCQWEVQHASSDPTSKFIHGPGSKKHYQDIIILPATGLMWDCGADIQFNKLHSLHPGSAGTNVIFKSADYTNVQK